MLLQSSQENYANFQTIRRFIQFFLLRITTGAGHKKNSIGFIGSGRCSSLLNTINWKFITGMCLCDATLHSFPEHLTVFGQVNGQTLRFAKSIKSGHTITKMCKRGRSQSSSISWRRLKSWKRQVTVVMAIERPRYWTTNGGLWSVMGKLSSL